MCEDGGYNPDFPFGNDVFLPAEPMTDEKFAVFVRFADDEVLMAKVDFSAPLFTDVVI